MNHRPWLTEPKLWDGEMMALRRGPSGAWCGYAAVGERHPLFGKGYDELVPKPDGWAERALDDASPIVPLFLHAVRMGLGEIDGDQVTLDCAVMVHGGITYAKRAWWSEHDPHWWFGFDCAHAGDLCPKYVDDPIMSRLNDLNTYRTFEYAKAQTIALAAQLARWRAS